MDKLTINDFIRLPKTDLHVHLDGSIRLETILDLAQSQRIRLPAEDVEGLRPFVQVGEGCKSLVEYLKAFDVTLSVMQTYDSLVRTAFELAEDAARENVRYLEVRYSPILHQQQGLTLHAIVQAVLEGLGMAEKAYGIRTGVILCGMRHISPEISLKLADLTVAFKNKGVVGFDLAGAEEDFPAKKHKEAFGRVLANNINCTLHAGEAYGPESIHQAIHQCGAHRIGHGVRLIEDGDLLNYVNDHRIPLECCPSSNVQTKAVKRMADHPMRLFFDLGLRVTVNTDNRLVTGTTVSREYQVIHEQLGFSLEEIQEIILMGFKSAFLPYAIKRAMLADVVNELKAFHPGSLESKREQL
ncbi:adenosine deaminase [Holophaga foetida]|uniref:adenosine deaminase n=1 Tax=Holophaga foetida TaxID=35839 RepID=UPI0002474A44|nr:adenosine deaminase [Holophaga foetida]